MKITAIVIAAASMLSSIAMADDFSNRFFPSSEETRTTTETTTQDNKTITKTTTETIKRAISAPPAVAAPAAKPEVKAIPQQAPPRARRPSYYPRANYIERDCCMASNYIVVPADRVNQSFNPSCNGVACY